DRGMRLEHYYARRRQRVTKRLRKEREGKTWNVTFKPPRAMSFVRAFVRFSLGILLRNRTSNQKFTPVSPQSSDANLKELEVRSIRVLGSYSRKKDESARDVPDVSYVQVQTEYGPARRLRKSDQPAERAKRAESNQLARKVRARFTARLEALLTSDKP